MGGGSTIAKTISSISGHEQEACNSTETKQGLIRSLPEDPMYAGYLNLRRKVSGEASSRLKRRECYTEISNKMVMYDIFDVYLLFEYLL